MFFNDGNYVQKSIQRVKLRMLSSLAFGHLQVQALQDWCKAISVRVNFKSRV